MPLTFEQTLKLLSTPNPDATGAYIAMGLNALVFLELGQYDAALGNALGAEVVARYGGGGPFEPHVLQLGGPGGAIFAFEGTRNYRQWIEYVTGAGVVNYQNRGDVFAPFATIAEPARLLVQGPAQAAGNVWFTGHSLGAGVAALLTPLIQAGGAKVWRPYLFAVPRCVGNRFLNNIGQRPIIINHPFDPVPLIAPDIVTDLRRDPLSLQFRGPIQAPGDPFWLRAHAVQVRGIGPLDWMAGVAAGFGGGEDSIHNTFRYIRDCFSEVPDELEEPLRAYTTLLQDLGLFDPWPANP